MTGVQTCALPIWPTAFAVNIAGAVPFGIKGTAKEFQGYNLIVIVKANSPYQKLGDLKGKKVAHTAPSNAFCISGGNR